MLPLVSRNIHSRYESFYKSGVFRVFEHTAAGGRLQIIALDLGQLRPKHYPDKANAVVIPQRTRKAYLGISGPFFVLLSSGQCTASSEYKSFATSMIRVRKYRMNIDEKLKIIVLYISVHDGHYIYVHIVDENVITVLICI